MELLLLGGTTEASGLARRLAGRDDIRTTLSLAGRTRNPRAAPVPTRIGGFGGIDGLVDWLRAHAIDRVVDATHPFAAGMSTNAARACARTGIPIARLSRSPWAPGPDDHWLRVADPESAAETLHRLGRRIFLTVGSHSIAPFETVPGKHWLVRSIDPPTPEPAFTDWTLIRSRGPFTLDEEIALLREHAIDTLVTKNSGGEATRPKLDAARAVGCRVLMIDRPELPPVDAEFDDPTALLAWLAWLDGAPGERQSSGG